MKKFICMAMTAIMAMGTTPVLETPHVFRAKVGTTEFTKDGQAQPLDVAVYIKDGYTMLPLRTFLTAALEYASMDWNVERNSATVFAGIDILTFDIEKNRIIRRNGAEIPVFGKMEVRDGRVFVPLRNWGNILNLFGYEVGKEDIVWRQAEKTAEIHALERKEKIEVLSAGVEGMTFPYKGAEAVFAFRMFAGFDELKNVGNGYFIAQKYEEDGFGMGEGLRSRENRYILIDDKTGDVKSYDVGVSLEEVGDGWLLLEERDGSVSLIDTSLHQNMEIQTYLRPRMVVSISEDMILVEQDGLYGFCSVSEGVGEKVKCRYEDAKDFSEGLAPVCVKEEYRLTEEGVRVRYEEWGYIDKTGKLVIRADYKDADPFSEGLARVCAEDGIGYINKNGKEVIPCQYQWGGYFRNGVTYVTDTENKTWLIDKKGEKLKLIAEGESLFYADDRTDDVNRRKNGVLRMEQIIDLSNGDHEHLFTYYDETGQISKEMYLLKKELSEGLSPWQDAETKKYGYVDANGVWRIAPAFDKAEPFMDGYAVVANEIMRADGIKDVEWGAIRYPQ